MWDDRRKVGVLNDFDLARFADQAGASGHDNTGTLPFMALDLLSEEGLRGEIPRRYRHEAESFAWSLICLCLATVENKKGKNFTMDPHPLYKWFEDWKSSRDAKIAHQWREHDHPDIPLVHPNAKTLARTLHKYWLDRFERQFPHPSKRKDRPRRLAGAFNISISTTEDPQYEEPEDDHIFLELLVEHEDGLDSQPLEGICDDFVKMGLRYNKIDWAA